LPYIPAIPIRVDLLGEGIAPKSVDKPVLTSVKPSCTAGLTTLDSN
jgi:hypothetical protein